MGPASFAGMISGGSGPCRKGPPPCCHGAAGLLLDGLEVWAGLHSIFCSSAMKILLSRYFLKEESDMGLGNFWSAKIWVLYL
jgi:hypothetical protein